jgi:hypothetical protein
MQSSNNRVSPFGTSASFAGNPCAGSGNPQFEGQGRAAGEPCPVPYLTARRMEVPYPAARPPCKSTRSNLGFVSKLAFHGN